MTTVLLKLESICAGGEHATISLTVNSALQGTYAYSVTDVLGAVTEDEKEIFVRLLTKVYKLGKSMAAAKAGLEAGVTVSV